MCGGEREFSVTFEDSQWVPVCMGLAKPLAWPLGDSAARLSGGHQAGAQGPQTQVLPHQMSQKDGYRL